VSPQPRGVLAAATRHDVALGAAGSRRRRREPGAQSAPTTRRYPAHAATPGREQARPPRPRGFSPFRGAIPDYPAFPEPIGRRNWLFAGSDNGGRTP
jgi:hypothetical protein